MRSMRKVETAYGTARVHVHSAPVAVGTVVLGHGAGGGVAARDLVAVCQAAVAQRFEVVLVEQPYRVAGRRTPPRAEVLDGAWREVLSTLRGGELAGLPLVVGGRSSGARVACRTAAEVGAVGVLCLAFPLVPPRRSGGTPARSRIDELDAVAVPTLVIQGEGDPFGVPPPGPQRDVVVVRGNHSLTSDLEAVTRAAGDWLGAVAVAR